MQINYRIASTLRAFGAALAANLFTIRNEFIERALAQETDLIGHGRHELIVLNPQYGKLVHVTQRLGQGSGERIVLEVKISQSKKVTDLIRQRTAEAVVVEPQLHHVLYAVYSGRNLTRELVRE